MTTTNPSTTSLAELTDVYEREGLLGIQALLSRKEEEVRKDEREAWKNGRRCEVCGNEKSQSHTWLTCEECD